MIAKMKELLVGVMVRLIGRFIMVYTWNVDLILAFDNVDESNLFLIVLLQCSRLLVNVVERRHRFRPGRPAVAVPLRRQAVVQPRIEDLPVNGPAQPPAAQPAEQPDHLPPAVNRRARAPRAPRVDPNNIIPGRRLRGRRV